VPHWLGVLVLPAVLAVYVPTCVPKAVLPTAEPGGARLAELWEARVDDLKDAGVMLTKLITHLNHGTSVEWEVKKFETVNP
jgi:hypothetical protein